MPTLSLVHLAASAQYEKVPMTSPSLLVAQRRLKNKSQVDLPILVDTIPLPLRSRHKRNVLLLTPAWMSDLRTMFRWHLGSSYAAFEQIQQGSLLSCKVRESHFLSREEDRFEVKKQCQGAGQTLYRDHASTRLRKKRHRCACRFGSGRVGRMVLGAELGQSMLMMRSRRGMECARCRSLWHGAECFCEERSEAYCWSLSRGIEACI